MSVLHKVIQNNANPMEPSEEEESIFQQAWRVQNNQDISEEKKAR